MPRIRDVSPIIFKPGTRDRMIEATTWSEDELLGFLYMPRLPDMVHKAAVALGKKMAQSLNDILAASN